MILNLFVDHDVKYRDNHSINCIMDIKSSNYKQVFESFLEYYKEQVKTIDVRHGFNFNVLTEQCGNIVENSHTYILMRLLQYRNKYGYVFLDDFISLAGFDIKINDGEVNFNTEYFGKTKAGQGRIDGLIWQQDNFAIIIENKINHAGNQEQQVARYIDSVLKERIVAQDKIFVVFLTRDGIENPDDFSQDRMKACGICDVIGEEEVAGPRYFACSYSNHIYNWLKDNIQPMISQKDVVLNAGVIQYIDFLSSLLGNQNQSLLKKCEKWFAENIQIEGDIPQQNNTLYEFYNYLSKLNSKHSDAKEAKEEMDSVNLLMNLIDRENDKLMGVFLSFTKEYYTSGQDPIIKGYHLNHHFTYYYVNIRDKRWPRGVEFGWYPLGMKKLKGSNELTFYFKFKGQKLDITDKQYSLLKELEFLYDERSKSYRKKIYIPFGKSYLGMTDKQQKAFLETVYKEYATPIIRQIIQF